MMERPSRHRPTGPFYTFKAAGFTLLELLVTLSIFALLLVAVFGSYRQMLQRNHHLALDRTRQEEIRLLVDQLRRDLQGMVIALPPHYRLPSKEENPDPHRFVANFRPPFSREPILLEFTTAAVSDTRRAADRFKPQRVRYRLKSNFAGGYRLHRQAAVHPYRLEKDPDAMLVLAEGISGFQLRMMDAAGRMQSHWDSDSATFGYATPTAVEVRFAMGAGPQSVPVEARIPLPVVRRPVNKAR